MPNLLQYYDASFVAEGVDSDRPLMNDRGAELYASHAFIFDYAIQLARQTRRRAHRVQPLASVLLLRLGVVTILVEDEVLHEESRTCLACVLLSRRGESRAGRRRAERRRGLSRQGWRRAVRRQVGVATAAEARVVAARKARVVAARALPAG